MKNFWVQTEALSACWSLDVSGIVRDPQLVLAFVESLLAVAASSELLIPIAIPRMGSPEGASLASAIRSRYLEEQVIDLFRGWRSGTTASRLGYYDHSDTVVEESVRNLGAVLQQLIPDRVPAYRRYADGPGIQLYGPLLYYRNGVLIDGPTVDCSIQVELNSDIWFPFVNGLAHPRHDTERFFDNRALASRHSPRLNRFLSTLQELAQSTGDGLHADRSQCYATLLPWIGDGGIALDGPVPELMPSSVTDGSWPAPESDQNE